MTKTLRVLLLLVACGFALAACAETTTSTFCSYDSDCPEEGNRFCVNGVCQADECRDTRDCAEGQSCVEGECTDG